MFLFPICLQNKRGPELIEMPSLYQTNDPLLYFLQKRENFSVHLSEEEIKHQQKRTFIYFTIWHRSSTKNWREQFLNSNPCIIADFVSLPKGQRSITNQVKIKVILYFIVQIFFFYFSNHLFFLRDNRAILPFS